MWKSGTVLLSAGLLLTAAAHAEIRVYDGKQGQDVVVGGGGDAASPTSVLMNKAVTAAAPASATVESPKTGRPYDGPLIKLSPQQLQALHNLVSFTGPIPKEPSMANPTLGVEKKEFPLGKVAVFVSPQTLTSELSNDLREVKKTDGVDLTIFIKDGTPKQLIVASWRNTFATMDATDEKDFEKKNLTFRVDSGGSAARSAGIKGYPAAVYETASGEKTTYDLKTGGMRTLLARLAEEKSRIRK